MEEHHYHRCGDQRVSATLLSLEIIQKDCVTLMIGKDKNVAVALNLITAAMIMTLLHCDICRGKKVPVCF